MSDNVDTRLAPLMRTAQDGDATSYQALLRGCVPVIAMIARQQGLSPDRVDDVVQETLMTIHRARATYDPRLPFLPWLRAIARRRAIDGLRAHGRSAAREVHDPGDPSMVQERMCLVFIVCVSVPLSLLLGIMLRRAHPLRPGLTAGLAGLAAAGAAATLLNLFHPYDAALSDLLVHVAAVALVVALNRVIGGRPLRI